MNSTVLVTPEWLAPSARIATRGDRARDVVLILPAELFERRTVQSVPRVRTAVLQRIVAADAERYFPLHPSGLVTTAEWHREGSVGVVARAYAVPRDTIGMVIDAASARALSVRDIRPTGAGRGASLLPASIRRERTKAIRRHLTRLVAAVACVAIAATEVARAGVERQRRKYLRMELPAVTTARHHRDILRTSLDRARLERLDRAATERMIGLVVGVGQALDGEGVVSVLHLRQGRVEEVGISTPAPVRVADALYRLQARPALTYEVAPTLEVHDSTLWSRMTLTAKAGR